MNVLAMILAGGEGPALSVLTAQRSEAAMPFAGKYRVIDFALSNCVNSGIFNVAVLTQYQPRSLEKQVMILFAGTRGHLDDVPVERVTEWEEAFYDYMDSNAPDVGNAIRDTKDLSDETAAALVEAIKAFKQSQPLA